MSGLLIPKSAADTSCAVSGRAFSCAEILITLIGSKNYQMSIDKNNN